MPRTKRAASAAPLKTAKTNQLKEIIKNKVDEEEKRILEIIDQKMEEVLEELEIHLANKKSTFPRKLWTRTLNEILNGKVEDSEMSTTTVYNEHISTFDSTRTTTKKPANDLSKTLNRTRTRIVRSASAGLDDEGYTTSESDRGTNSGSNTRAARQSRSRTKSKVMPVRVSRSLSRNINSQVNAYKTPANKAPPTNTGTITPKCKANTPLMFVRRPKVGEMAWSNQGSPLLVSSTLVVKESANVNIPVGEEILSLLPTKGQIPTSQLPEMEVDTRRQLEILRDNLISVCRNFKNK